MPPRAATPTLRVQRRSGKGAERGARISDPGVLASAERRGRSWRRAPRTRHRIGEVRDALATLDEIIAQLRVSVGITRFDLSLSALLRACRRRRRRAERRGTGGAAVTAASLGRVIGGAGRPVPARCGS
jgi:hypothetical protein